MQIHEAKTPEDIANVRLLFREYEAFLNVNLCFQGFEEELAKLPGKYAPPEGVLLLAEVAQAAVGCGALRRLGPGICEMKRLFVRPACRRLGLGKALAVRLVNTAVDLGYSTMRLDTLDRLQAAIRLYEGLGFVQTEPYYANPLPRVVYLELDLRRWRV